MSASKSAPSEMSQTLALLDRMKTELPEVWNQAQVVGQWVWLEFNTPPLASIRGQLKKLGFHWNGTRKCWQHPCGVSRPGSRHDPRGKYPVSPAQSLALNDAPASPNEITSKEFKIVALRECPLPEDLLLCDDAQKAADYWRATIATNPYFNPECECFAVLILTTRR